MTGQIVSHFRILEQIGRGGMGVVYKAEDLHLHRPVALKFLAGTSDKDSDLGNRLMQEARAACTLEHPNICTIYEVAETGDGQLFIAMSYYRGQTLDRRIANGPLSVAESIEIEHQLAQGLAVAHASRIVHRDIKPANLMLTEDRLLKILDFGLAKLGDSPLTKSGVTMGTVAYMSPEQITGAPVDHRTDLWSAGIVLYEMLAGRVPFGGAGAGNLLYSILHNEPPAVTVARPDIPLVLVQVVSRALAKKPSERYQSAEELLADLEALPVSKSRFVTARDLTSRESLNAPTRTVAVITERKDIAPSVAVLPFVNMSSNEEHEYFADGITDELILRLSKIPGVKVIARTSSMRYKETKKPLTEIGQELAVSRIVEGTVRWAGKRVRITCGLVDAASSRQLWGEIYDREITDIFAIQSEVAHSIADALHTTFATDGISRTREKTRNIEAYHLYLRGRYFLNKQTPDGIVKGLSLFQQALDIDPADARVYAGISTCYACAGHYGVMPPGDAFPKATQAARNALNLDSSLAEAHTSLALVTFIHDWNWEESEKSFRRAIELNASYVEAHAFFSTYLCAMRRFDEALSEAHQALTLDPLSPFASANLACVLAMAGRAEQALEQCRRTLEIDPGYFPVQAIMCSAYCSTGRFAEAVQVVKQWTWNASSGGICYALAGHEQEARAILREASVSSSPQFRSSEMAIICLILGEREQAAEWLDRAFQERDHFILFHVSPDWMPYRTDPLIVNHLRRMQFPLETPAGARN